ncbi:hypothetical protein OF83DRAFT_755348 [Amylostereum chailletii]|nr:hypothetical protein OF83DRAFT_755348 [Amylostereum chailletii]
MADSPSAGGASLPINPFAGISWDNTLGALLVGGLISGMLFGITCTQAYLYFERYSTDRWTLKAFVGCLWALDIFDFALNGHILYWYLVTNYTNPLALEGKVVWSLSAHVLVTSVVDFMIRAMFARRIFRLSNGNVPLTAGVLATSLLDLVVGIVITVKTVTLGSIANLETLSTLFYINFASGAGSDVYVAVVLCYYLARSRTGFNTRTDSVVTVLMLYTINTGLLTAVDATCGMVLFITMPDNFVFIAFYLQLSKLYTNAYLATLNNRGSLRERSEGDGIVSIHLSRISGRESDPQRSVTTVGSKVGSCSPFTCPSAPLVLLTHALSPRNRTNSRSWSRRRSASAATSNL